jgi:hypothetical protein
VCWRLGAEDRLHDRHQVGIFDRPPRIRLRGEVAARWSSRLVGTERSCAPTSLDAPFPLSARTKVSIALYALLTAPARACASTARVGSPARKSRGSNARSSGSRGAVGGDITAEAEGSLAFVAPESIGCRGALAGARRSS